MTPPDKNGSDFAKNSLAAIVGTVLGGLVLVWLAGLWSGTISGPANQDFWQQIAPFALVGLVMLLLVVSQTRRVIFNVLGWLFSLRVLTRKQRHVLPAQGKASPNQRLGLRSGVPGLTKHGRLSALLNIHTGVLTVKWMSNRAVVGTLHPGRAGGWDVLYHETGETLGWVDSKESGMERLEMKALEEHQG